MLPSSTRRVSTHKPRTSSAAPEMHVAGKDTSATELLHTQESEFQLIEETERDTALQTSVAVVTRLNIRAFKVLELLRNTHREKDRRGIPEDEITTVRSTRLSQTRIQYYKYSDFNCSYRTYPLSTRLTTVSLDLVFRTCRRLLEGYQIAYFP